MRKQASAQTEPSVIKTYEVTNSEFAEKYFENDQLVTMVRYYEMSDATWKTDDYTFQYRLVITGRMNNAAKDSTFVFFVYFVKCFSQKSERKIPNLRNGIFPYISRKHFHMIMVQSVA